MASGWSGGLGLLVVGLLAGAGLLWLALVLLVAAGQDVLVFPGHLQPGPELRARWSIPPEELVVLPTGPEHPDSLGWLRDGGARAVLFLHGNGDRLDGTGPVTAAWRRAGFTTLAVTYPGYGGVEGTPSEGGAVAAARAGWDLLRERGFAADEIVISAHSMGGGVAGLLLDEVSPGAVVVQSTFTSLRQVAAERYPLLPVRPLLRHPFDVQARWARVQAPVLVLHGTADATVPVRHGRALARIIPHATYVEVPSAGHELFSVQPPHWARVQRFVDEALPPGGAR